MLCFMYFLSDYSSILFFIYYIFIDSISLPNEPKQIFVDMPNNDFENSLNNNSSDDDDRLQIGK